MRKLLSGILICLSVASCGTAKYARHYKANLDQYSRLIAPVKDPAQFGDSLEDKINGTIENVRENISKNTHTDVEGMGVGAAGILAGKVLPVGKANQNLIVSISITGIAIGIIDLFLSTIEPAHYYRKAIEISTAWDHSTKDNAALTSLRASLYALQETWPAYAP